MPTTLNEIPKVFQHGETLESAELNAIIQQVNSTIRKLNSVETNLENHGYDVSIPITNIYCRTKKGINAINFFPQADAKRDELLDQVSNCSTTQGIKYNTTFSTITLSENADLMNGVWTAYPQGVNESLPHEWEVSYKKLTDNSIMYMYGPVLRSNYGYSGADGDSVQYVYKTFNHLLTDIERTNNTPTRPENPDSNGEFIPSGWFDDPQGPTEEYPFEYVSTLKRINGTWGSFEKISLWSTYTEDGTNGDYYARAFCRFIPTDNKLTPNRPIGGTYENPQPGSNDNIQWSLTIPAEDNNNKGPIWTSTRIFKGNNQSTQWSIPVVEADSAELDIEYSSQVEKPDPDTTLRTIPKTANPSNIWYDPSEANIDLSTMIWRAERKIKNGQYDGNWVITKIAGQKGDFKSIVFRRFKPTTQQLVPPTPTGGIYSNPIPDGGLWHDGIPSGDIKTYGPVWASTKIFHDDGTQTNWSTPQLQSDSENLDIEFSPSENQPNDPEGEEPFSNREAQGWYDPSSSNFDSHGPMIWRAERKVQNGVYNGSWTVTRIVGEQGPEGKRGSFKSCVFRRSNSVLSNFNAINNQGEIIDGATYENPVPTGWSDGIPSGTEVLWMAVSRFTGEGNAHSNWTVTQQTDSVDLDIEFSPGEGTGHTCPQINPTNINDQNDPYQIFTYPINNKDINGNKSTERRIREGLGWYDSSDLPSETMIWRAERKINGFQQYEGDWVVTRITGEKGDSTTLTESQQQDLDSAGLQIVVTPQNIILDQSDVLTGANDDKIDDVVANIVVYDRTGDALNNNQYRIATDGVSIYATKTDGTSELLTPISNFVDITEADLINAKSVKIKNLPITTTTVNGTSTYTYTYNKGYIRVILTIPVGTSTKNIKIDIPWYLNKLGERIEKLKGDISETYLSRDVFTNDHTNKTIKQEFDAYIKESAEGRLAQYGLIQSAQGGGYEAAFDAQYIQNASENIAKLTKSVTTTNLIADNGWSNSFSSTQISGKYKTSCSPFVYLKAGKYIFSTYINSNTTVNNNIKLFAKQSNTKLDPSTLLTDYSNEGWQAIAFNGILEADANTGYEGDYYPSASASPNYVRMYFVFTVETSGTFQEGYYTFHVSQNNTNFTTCLRPQLEICLDSNTDQMPTAWTPGPQDFSSEIKQTADEITFAIAGPNKTLSEFKQTVDGISQTVSNHTGQFSAINQRLDSISIQTGVSESTLNTAGLYLRAGQNDSPSMVKVMAGQFKVVLPPEEEGDPEEIIFGNDPSTNTMVFSGSIKSGEDYDFYMSSFPQFDAEVDYDEGACVKKMSNGNWTAYKFTSRHRPGAWKTGNEVDYIDITDQIPFVPANTITDTYGRLGGGKIYWNQNGDIYIGPFGATPLGNAYAKDDFTSGNYDLIFEKEQDGKYPTDGIRIINKGWSDTLHDYNTAISIQADSNLELSLGRLTLDNQGMISISHLQNDEECNIKMSKNQGFEISRKEYIDTGDSDRDELYGFSGAMTISHATLPEGCNSSPLINSSDEDTGDYGSHNFSLKTYVKGRNGKAYKGFTGTVDGGLTFINGICIGPSSGFSSADDKNPWRAYGQST